MARRLLTITLGGTVVEGTTLAAQGTAIQALITTALGNAGGSYNSTTDITAIQTAVTAATAAWGGNIVFDFDTAKLTTITQLTDLLHRLRDWLGQIGLTN